MIRHFQRMGPNQLFQLCGMMIGQITDEALTISQIIGTSETDNVGPISIHRGSQDDYIGKWSGGVHTVLVDGVEYPTACQVSLHVFCNGAPVTEDGFYYGTITIEANNDLYFPHSVTSDNLEDAEKALCETRVYTLTDRMQVEVTLDFYVDCYLTQYYGCQCVAYGMDTLHFPNNQAFEPILRNTSYVGIKPETSLIAQSDNAYYHVTVKPVGLGTFGYNTGTAEDVGYCYLAPFGKFYFVLIANELGETRVATAGSSLFWEAEYFFYFDYSTN